MPWALSLGSSRSSTARVCGYGWPIITAEPCLRASLIAACNCWAIAGSVRSSSRNTSRETLARPIFCASAAATVWALVRLSTKNLLRRCNSLMSQAMAGRWDVMRLPMWLLMPLV